MHINEKIQAKKLGRAKKKRIDLLVYRETGEARAKSVIKIMFSKAAEVIRNSPPAVVGTKWFHGFFDKLIRP